MKKSRKIIKDEIIEKVEKYVSSYKAFEAIIDIYVDMRLQQEELKEQLCEYPEYEESHKTLSDILDNLEADIKEYEIALLIK